MPVAGYGFTLRHMMLRDLCLLLTFSKDAALLKTERTINILQVQQCRPVTAEDIAKGGAVALPSGITNSGFCLGGPLAGHGVELPEDAPPARVREIVQVVQRHGDQSAGHRHQPALGGGTWCGPATRSSVAGSGDT